jgi:hypothetical protein
MAKTIITLKDDLSLAVIQHAIDREERLLTLAINQVEEKLAAFEARFGTRDRQSLFGTVDDMDLIEWEGEEDTLARLRQRLQRLKEIQVEPR